ncbi:hypothetical protein LX32DRAFT_305038 [Colletotrichum zoysiae]|uniref:Uncharacterized protein n=1 Tax=Colletotrichum zoysiae TaxID=1216348 RepID=A0AAD9H1D4_9PEZI|nr:hypothetical protein LX32DRAFT_305038 [Colletotrichum zoysiae]
MHHTRRKSGNTSMSEKTVTASDPSRYGKRPSTLTRRQTPQKLGKSPRDRERELQDSWDDQRESFPQFWYVYKPPHKQSFLPSSWPPNRPPLSPSRVFLFFFVSPRGLLGVQAAAGAMFQTGNPRNTSSDDTCRRRPMQLQIAFPFWVHYSVTMDHGSSSSSSSSSSCLFAEGCLATIGALSGIVARRTTERSLADWLRSSMTCEKQFVPQDANFLYCSEACRKHDQQSASTGRAHSQAHMSNYPFYAIGNPEPRDIVPRASPSRPNSMHFSPPTTPGTNTGGGAHYSSAVSALRSLSIRPPSPPSPSTSHPSLWPFTKSTTNSPGTSYNRGTNSFFPATYDGGYAANGNAYNYSSSGMDRPLPTRRPTGPGYSRPKSIELVTPMVGR